MTVLLDLSVYFFSLWTISSHIAVFLKTKLILSTDFFYTTKYFFTPKYLKYFSKDYSKTQRQLNLSLILLCISAVLFNLVIHRADIDDCFHLNTAATLAENPSLPVGSFTSIMYLGTGKYWLPEIWRLQSFDYLVGFVSLITGLQAVVITNFIFAPFFALLLVLAYRNLFESLQFKRLFTLCLAALIFLIADGHRNASVGNLGGLVRLHQGIGVFFAVFVPLLVAKTIYAIREPSKKNLFNLLFANIAAIGFSSSAIIIAPLIVSITILSQLKISSVKDLVKILSSTFYLAVVALLAILLFEDPNGKQAFININSLSLADVTALSIGDQPFTTLIITLVFTSSFFLRNEIAKRFVLWTPIISLLFYNPIVFQILGDFVFSKWIYYRLIFLFQIPSLVAISIDSVFIIFRNNKLLANGIFFISLMSLLFMFSSQRVFDPENSINNTPVKVSLFGLKVDQKPYEMAKEINSILPQGSIVLAPFEVAVWIPTFRKHSLALLARTNHIPSARKVLEDSDLDLRIKLVEFVTGEGKKVDPESLLKEGLLNYPLQLICLNKSVVSADIKKYLNQKSFFIKRKTKDYYLFVR